MKLNGKRVKEILMNQTVVRKQNQIKKDEFDLLVTFILIILGVIAIGVTILTH